MIMIIIMKVQRLSLMGVHYKLMVVEMPCPLIIVVKI
nr:MAG TPA: hypothetical protein [Crassvirales sp.]